MASRTEKQRFFDILDSFDQEQAENDRKEGHVPLQKHKVNAVPEREGAIHACHSIQRATLPSNPQQLESRVAHLEPTVKPPAPTAGSRASTIRKDGQGVAKDAHLSIVCHGIFHGLVFYFIPNDDVAKPRRLRIQSAINQGAIWARHFHDHVTHIIVDGDVDAEAVARLKQFRSTELKPYLNIVKSSWLIECLGQKELKDPGQSRFQLKRAATVFSHLRSVKRAFKRTTTKTCLLPHRPLLTRKAAPSPNSRPNETQDSLDQIIKDVRGALQSGTEDPDMTHLLAGPSFDDDFASDSAMGDATKVQNETFQCMHPPRDGLSASNPNAKTIEILQKMASYYDRTGDQWRSISYRKGISALKRQKTMITNAKQAYAIPAIGPRLADKIEEIVTTSHLRRLDATLEDPSDNALQLFMGVYGVGYQQARLWVSQGLRTLEDLRSKAKLTDNQIIGLEHYDDFTQRIPRSEVEKHGAIVSKALSRADPQLKAILGGSYRRGNSDSGDIDILITSRDHEATSEHIRDVVMTKLVPVLTQVGFLKCALASSFRDQSEIEKSTASKWHGASALPAQADGSTPPWHRIDLLIAPPSELGAALLYFTGNDILNRSMRLLASKKGMRLNQRGLYQDVMRGKGREKVTEGTLLEGRSETKIFEILGVPWREPEDRNC